MKKELFTGIMACCCILFSSVIYAQDTTTAGQDIKNAANKTGKAISKSAKKVANKTAELASKGKAGVIDKIYQGKQGAEGQKIYINKQSKYYWVDKKGHQHFVTEAELKDKAN